MSTVAFCFGSRIIYWDSVIIALAAAAGSLALPAFYLTREKKGSTLCLLAPIAMVLSFVIARALFWYFHQEQYTGLWDAFAQLATGDYLLCGIVLGYLAAVGLLRLVGIERDSAFLLDASAAPLSLCLALLRISSLFNNSCRGKVVITEPLLQRLPFSYPTLSSAGVLEYRYAAFFTEALLFALFAVVLAILFVRFCPKEEERRPAHVRSGDVFLFFLVLYSATELVIDSTRNDATFSHLNAFVSVAQVLSAVTILAVLIDFSQRSIKRRGLRTLHWALWSSYLVSLGGIGACEYLVQRHGDWQLRCYGFMSLSVLLMLTVVWLLYRDSLNE